MEDRPANHASQVSLSISTLFTKFRPRADRCRYYGGLRIRQSLDDAKNAILSRHSDFDVCFIAGRKGNPYSLPLLIAVRPGELLTASFTPPPTEPRATIIGRALLYQVGPTLNLQESTLFDVLDECLRSSRSEIRAARVQWRFSSDEAARQASHVSARFDPAPHIRHEPPADAFCALRDHIQLFQTSGRPEDVQESLAQQDAWSKGAMYHHLWLTSVREDYDRQMQKELFVDCVLE